MLLNWPHSDCIAQIFAMLLCIFDVKVQIHQMTDRQDTAGAQQLVCLREDGLADGSRQLVAHLRQMERTSSIGVTASKSNNRDSEAPTSVYSIPWPQHTHAMSRQLSHQSSRCISPA